MIHWLNAIFIRKRTTKKNMGNRCVYSRTLKVQVLGFRGIALNINSLLGSLSCCVHAQWGSFGNQSRGNLLCYQYLKESSSNEP